MLGLWSMVTRGPHVTSRMLLFLVADPPLTCLRNIDWIPILTVLQISWPATQPLGGVGFLQLNPKFLGTNMSPSCLWTDDCLPCRCGQLPWGRGELASNGGGGGCWCLCLSGAFLWKQSYRSLIWEANILAPQELIPKAMELWPSIAPCLAQTWLSLLSCSCLLQNTGPKLLTQLTVLFLNLIKFTWLQFS